MAQQVLAILEAHSGSSKSATECVLEVVHPDLLQHYKAMKALREAQEWRLKTLEATPQSVDLDRVGVVDDA